MVLLITEVICILYVLDGIIKILLVLKIIVNSLGSIFCKWF